MQFAEFCVPAKLPHSVKASFLQVLQFQELSDSRVLIGGTGVSQYWTIVGFLQRKIVIYICTLASK
jgi:hypothetical protein